NKTERHCLSTAYSIVKTIDENLKIVCVCKRDNKVYSLISHKSYIYEDKSWNPCNENVDTSNLILDLSNSMIELSLEEPREHVRNVQEADIEIRVPIHLAPDLSPTYTATNTNDNEVLDEFSTKLSINDLGNLMEKVTKDSTLYYLAKICDTYESFDPKNTDVKKKLDENLKRDITALVNSSKKAKKLRNIFGVEFAKQIAIPPSVLKKTNTDNLIAFIRFFKENS
ncbi:16805_t:CDS:2, partial [Dentiscutata erythropus]